jgi:hypothetical protein
VLHDFDDDQCVTILSNCRAAMGNDGRVLIANLDLPAAIDGPNPNVVMDIQMMFMLGGRERSTPEWSELFGRSGLKLVDTFETGAGFTLTEAMPD